MTLLRIYILTGATVVATASAMAWLNAHKKTPEQREALRRQRISAHGRITDGTVLDVREINSATGHSVQMIHYA
jgi:predicted aconitase